MLDSQRGEWESTGHSTRKSLLESTNDLRVLLWVKSDVTSRIWRPQLSGAKENGHHRTALPGGALTHDAQFHVCLKFYCRKVESRKRKHEYGFLSAKPVSVSLTAWGWSFSGDGIPKPSSPNHRASRLPSPAPSSEPQALFRACTILHSVSDEREQAEPAFQPPSLSAFTLLPLPIHAAAEVWTSFL